MILDLRSRFTEREQLVDPGFEIWSSGTTLANWSTTGVVTIAQDASEKYSGSYSCKATRSDGVTFSTVSSSSFNVPVRSWIYAGARGKGTLATVNGLRLRLLNLRTGLSWDEATQAWTSSGSFFRNVLTTDYTLAAGWIPLFDSGLLGTDMYRFDLAGYFNAGESIWYDDASVKGPYARPVSQLGLSPLTYHGLRDVGRRAVFAV